MVEAAGVEPASENVTGQEPTYLAAKHNASYPDACQALRNPCMA